jgi:hypothetical protein
VAKDTEKIASPPAFEGGLIKVTRYSYIWKRMIPKRMKHLLFLPLFFLFSFSLQAQTSQPLDTVYLMSGRTVTGVVKDSTDDQLKILTPKKKGGFKADFIDLDLVFSVRYRDGHEEVFYKQDTLFGNYFTPQEVRYFIYGERDARVGYHCPVWLGGAFVAGFAGGYTRSILAPLPVFGYAGLTTVFRIKIKPGSVSNPDNIRYDTYVLGYEKESRKKRMIRSMVWGGLGMVAGICVSKTFQTHQIDFLN